MTPTKIEWADYTWNIVTGCENGCDYCYARRLAEGRLKGRFGYPKVNPFKPTFHHDRLNAPSKVKKPSRIFVCSMGELFGNWVPDSWFISIRKVVWDNPQHTFIFLTKCPDGMDGWVFPKNAWCGISANYFGALISRCGKLKGVHAKVRFASIEPLHGWIPILPEWLEWVIIGAETGHRKGRIEPESEWIEHLTQEADNHNIPIFHKDNLAPYYEGELRREFPKP